MAVLSLKWYDTIPQGVVGYVPMVGNGGWQSCLMGAIYDWMWHAYGSKRKILNSYSWLDETDEVVG